MTVIIGDPTDPHVVAVTTRLSREPVVIDASSWAATRITLREQTLIVNDRRIRSDRGWVRRLMPSGWNLGGLDSVESAERVAALSALAAVLRLETITWLTPVDSLGAAENKPYQYRRVASAGVPVPEWLVTTDAAEAPLTDAWVAKPLGPGGFTNADGSSSVVPASVWDPRHRDALAGAPFLLQRRVNACTHARVVTVGSAVFSSTLPAEGLPLDWRVAPAAHTSFTDSAVPADVQNLARTAAAAVDAGFSAQDWMLDRDGRWWFVDLNPAGQWLFLPDAVANPISDALSRFLDGAQ